MSDILLDAGSGGGSTDQYPYGRNAPHPPLDSPLSKSWLFEIVNRETKKIIESFTLVLPPTGLTIKEPQRVSITKTFGNVFVDDYGPDNIQITIKGISGTVHAFPTFRPSGTSETFTDIDQAAVSAASRETSGYTGRRAFYTFRDSIIRYKHKSGWSDQELRVYDLADEQAYKCVLLDFVLDRNADKPLRYPFTISLFVYERLDKPFTGYDTAKRINIAEDPITGMNAVDSLLNNLQAAYQDVLLVANAISIALAEVRSLRTQYTRYLAQTYRTLTLPLDIAKNLIDTMVLASTIATETWRLGKLTFDRYMGLQELLREGVLHALKIYGSQIGQGSTSITSVIENDGGVDIENGGRIVVWNGYEYSGFRIYTVRGEDTLQSIALSELGDENLWLFIVSVNTAVFSNDDLTAGMELFIPVQTNPEDVPGDVFIMSEDTSRDPYGSDIRLDSNGSIVVQENSDVALISGLLNIQQAVDLILSTSAGSMIKQTAFGIQSGIGFAGTSFAVRYVKMAIRLALTSDPRIESVDNLIVLWEKDRMYVSMNIKIVNAEATLPVTTIIT